MKFVVFSTVKGIFDHYTGHVSLLPKALFMDYYGSNWVRVLMSYG